MNESPSSIVKNKPLQLVEWPENWIIVFFLQVGPGQSHSIGLRFTPQQFPGKAEIFIFINDSDDKNEETFSINAVYT